MKTIKRCLSRVLAEHAEANQVCRSEQPSLEVKNDARTTSSEQSLNLINEPKNIVISFSLRYPKILRERLSIFLYTALKAIPICVVGKQIPSPQFIHTIGN